MTSNLGQVIEESESVEVEFNIYSKDTNDPLERVEVQFIFDGAPAPRFTNSDGYVRIEIPKRDDIDIVIKKEGFKDLNRTINLKADINRTITYLLERDENYSSYNLYGDGFSNGMLIKRVSSSRGRYSFSYGELRDSSVNNPFLKFNMDELVNEESEYEILDSSEGKPFELIERIGLSTDSVSAEMNAIMSQENKIYTYNSALSEGGAFADTSVFHKYSDGKWNRHIIGKQPSKLQALELSESWSLDNVFLEYPRTPLKLGQSWNLDHVFWSSGDGVIDSSVQATLEKITEYEGQPAALISLDGYISYIEADRNENSDTTQDISLSTKAINNLQREFYADYAEEYILSTIKKTMVGDLYYNEFTLNDGSMKEKKPKLYNLIIEIYREIIDDPELAFYSLSEIEEIVDEEIDSHSVLDEVIEILESKEDSNTDNKNDNLKQEVTVSGKVYRSLQKPIDLYQEAEGIFKIAQGSDTAALDVVYRYSIVKG